MSKLNKKKLKLNIEIIFLKISKNTLKINNWVEINIENSQKLNSMEL